jgi:opacity protein-like surface antigen
MDVSIIQLTGNDNLAGGAHPSRGLSFKSTVTCFSLSPQISLTKMLKQKFGPYAYAGIGFAIFNSTAVGASGKVNLRDLKTEGKSYSNKTAIFPMGFGLRYSASSKVYMKLGYSIVFTNTDYLDDVSMAGYPDPATLSPATKAFTWRGAGPYPANLKLARGNPNKKDVFYTTELKVGFSLGKK